MNYQIQQLENSLTNYLYLLTKATSETQLFNLRVNIRYTQLQLSKLKGESL